MTPEMNITGQFTDRLSAYFSKGIVSAQWVSRALDTAPKAKSIKDLIGTVDNPLRDALSGLLRPEIISLLDDAKKSGGKLFVALYELNNPQVIVKVETYGQKTNMNLEKGAFKPTHNDENKKE